LLAPVAGAGFAFGFHGAVDAAVGYVTNRSGTFLATAVASSTGKRMRLEDDAELVALWPCRRPVGFYVGGANGRELTMWALGARHSVSLGEPAATNPVFDSSGRLVTPPRSPLQGWRVSRFAPSPALPSAFLDEIERDCMSGTGRDTGRLYIVAPGGATRLASYDSCINPPLAVWSANGSAIFWTTSAGHPLMTRFHVADASGGNRRDLGTVRGNVTYALWSPDGKTVAYSVYTASAQVGDVNVMTGQVIHLTHIHWTPTPPPRQPPDARVVGWSPDSKRVLIVEAKPNGAGTSIVSVPVRGPAERVLIRLPQ
jgi:hypothetical protein